MYLDLQIYSGLGNIIAIVDSVRKDISIDSKIVLSLYENKGINFDQLIQILPPLSPENDFDVKIYNNDGSLASNCINGARCCLLYTSPSPRDGLLSRMPSSA